MKMIIIGHAHIIERNRIDFEYLQEEIELQFLFPKKWKGSLREYTVNDIGFKKLSIPFIKNAYIPFLMQREADILWIDEEPISPQTYFIIKHFNKIPLKIIRTAQNIEKRDFYRNMMYNYVNKHIDTICAVGKLASENAKKIFNRDIPVVNHAIPDEYFFEREINFNNKLKIGIAGRIDKSKGIKYIMDIIKYLKNRVKFIIVGSGEEEKRLLHTLKDVKADYEYRGYVKHSQMIDFYKDIDILINTSITLRNWKEQYGRIITEALASGITVISFDSGEIPFVLANSGILIEEGDSDSIIKYIIDIDKNRNILIDYKEKAINRAKRFNIMNVGRSIYEIIKQYK